MFNATYFRYDGRWSGTYGLQIVDFDESSVRETDAFSPTLSLQKVPGSLKFIHGGVEYDTAPQCEFSVLSEQALNGAARSAIMSWLIGRKTFKPMKFEDGDNDNFTYYCVFTSAKTIWINGRCHGFRLTAQFDSPFARGEATVATGSAGTTDLTMMNYSDIMDDYTYPLITFNGTSIDIVNKSDDPNRHFVFSGLSGDETILVDNETKLISSNKGGGKLNKFTSKNWLRLRKGLNDLQVTTDGDFTITCPYYAMIGY